MEVDIMHPRSVLLIIKKFHFITKGKNKMSKKFIRMLVFIVGMTIALGVYPMIAMDDEDTPLTNHSKNMWYEKAKKEGEYTTESTRLKKNIKHVEPGCCQSVQYIRTNFWWQPWKLDVPYYDISDFTPGCGTCCSIFCCFFCCSPGDHGGCYFSGDDLMCFDTWKLKKGDTEGDGKVMTRRDALRVMEVVNREKLEYYSNNPELRVEMWQTSTTKLTGVYADSGASSGLYYHYRDVPEGPVHILRSKMVIKYERELRAKGMNFVAHDLDSNLDSDSDS